MVWGRSEWEHKAETLPIPDIYTWTERNTDRKSERVSVRERKQRTSIRIPARNSKK